MEREREKCEKQGLCTWETVHDSPQLQRGKHIVLCLSFGATATRETAGKGTTTTMTGRNVVRAQHVSWSTTQQIVRSSWMRQKTSLKDSESTSCFPMRSVASGVRRGGEEEKEVWRRKQSSSLKAACGGRAGGQGELQRRSRDEYDSVPPPRLVFLSSFPPHQ